MALTVEDLGQIKSVVVEVLDVGLDAKLNERFGKFEAKIDEKLDERFAEFEGKIDAKIGDLAIATQKQFLALDARFDAVDRRLDGMDRRLSNLEDDGAAIKEMVKDHGFRITRLEHRKA